MRSISEDIKRRAIFDKYRQSTDFLILQETHSIKDTEQCWKNEWGGKCIFSHGTSAARGIAVFYNVKLNVKNIITGEDGRFIIFDVESYDQLITVVAIYAPNQDSPTFFTGIREKLKERGENKIIVGDFNLTLNVELDRKNTYCNNNKAKEEVENIMDEFCLRDTWRVQNEQTREYSWFKAGDLTKASRIDFALVSGGLDQKTKAISYIPGIFTDHRALYLYVELFSTQRGVGYWKFNNTLLYDIKFVEIMNQEIETTLDITKDKGALERWEKLKIRIKNRSKEYAKNKASEELIIIGNLSEKVNEFEVRLPLTKEETELWIQTRAELEEKILERTKGIMFRSKAKWVEEGEKNTKYFFALEKARYNSKTCYKMIDEQGTEIVQQQDIIQLQKNFYQELYKSEEDVQFSLVNTFNVKVPDNIREQQEIQVTIADLQEAIKTMNNNKTPGEDGIPVDFYKVFWPKLAIPFYNMVTECYEQGILHQSARRGILNLIPKAGKDSRMVKNLRPITLLNTDYKIIEKAVANKMIPALEHIINKDQRGFMKNRRISVNIRKMLDIMHYTEREDLEAVILSLDFVKCFDKCSFTILHGSLEYFQFGEIVKKWTKILYNDFKVKIQNNGNFSSSILIEKGVHQGGCCSSVYFLVIAEILALTLRHNEEIEGIPIKTIRHLLNQFADDMDIASLCTKKSIKGMLKELNSFKLQSGFTVSYDKTTMYRIGSLRHSSAQMYSVSEVEWTNEDISVLGVTIAHEEIVQKNYSGLIDKTRSTLNAWHNRNLSLIGKVQVVNTLVAWNGKKAKIAFFFVFGKYRRLFIFYLHVCKYFQKDLT